MEAKKIPVEAKKIFAEIKRCPAEKKESRVRTKKSQTETKWSLLLGRTIREFLEKRITVKTGTGNITSMDQKNVVKNLRDIISETPAITGLERADTETQTVKGERRVAETAKLTTEAAEIGLVVEVLGEIRTGTQQDGAEPPDPDSQIIAKARCRTLGVTPAESGPRVALV